MGITAGTRNSTLPRARLNVAVTVSALQHAARVGIRARFEDLSDLLAPKKRRGGGSTSRSHEIKNPLTRSLFPPSAFTPFSTRHSADAASLEVIRIARTMANGRRDGAHMVDEFSVLARFPAARPQPASLNSLVESRTP